MQTQLSFICVWLYSKVMDSEASLKLRLEESADFVDSSSSISDLEETVENDDPKKGIFKTVVLSFYNLPVLSIVI